MLDKIYFHESEYSINDADVKIFSMLCKNYEINPSL